MAGPEEILSFWLDEVEPKDWYVASDALDETIKERFLPDWEKAMKGGLGQWMTYPSGCLAYIILMDQFSRNMFRGDGRSFASDRRALAVAKSAIKKGWDLKIDQPARMFFYMPLMHSENLCDQDRCVRLIKDRLENAENNLLHARAHREVIRMFGRFPHRNADLDRRCTEAEKAFLDKGGYGATVQELQAA
ncbi:DUF924 family protein [Cognatishimia maritima]|uniref:Uncharacterized conserved protein, DUF924 family n=1 Tax=Cognatishimia maritima TaxID=870908 RepID=A0A1M5JE02_9RHOB|nr:DUF924 family protein [Cognatishimia maritima]SHG38836.1 Uncharacterized conserved protein, DUF924 family [Cognatishimia maritima]